MSVISNITSIGLAGGFVAAYEYLVRDAPLLAVWLKRVPQDSDGERVLQITTGSDEKGFSADDVRALWASFRVQLKSELLQDPRGQSTRRSAMAFLNSWFLDERVFNLQTDAALAYEMLFRLEKFAAVVSVAEAENLKSFDGHLTPQWTDVPTALAHFCAWICDARRNWSTIQERQKAHHAEMCSKGRVWLSHYAVIPEDEKLPKPTPSLRQDRAQAYLYGDEADAEADEESGPDSDDAPVPAPAPVGKPIPDADDPVWRST